MFVAGQYDLPEVRAIVPSHIVRSGFTSAFDANFGMECGGAALYLMLQGVVGVTVTGYENGTIHYMDIADAIKQRTVELEEVALYEQLGFCFGRPRQEFSAKIEKVSGLIDRALELNQSDPALKGMMAPSKIGASGHSLGGYTTMALAGGVYDCVDPAKWPAESCAKVDALIRNKSTMRPEDFDIRMMGEQTACCLPEMKGRRASFGDPRVSAALPLGPAVMFPDRAFPEVKMPVMIITGEGKFEVPFEPIQKAYADLAGPKYLLELKRVDHMTITDVAYKIVLARLVLPGFSSQYRTKKEIYENFSENFFNGYLKDDAAGREYIREAHYPLVNLSARP